MYQNITSKRGVKKSLLLLFLATFALPVWSEQVDENTARRVTSQTLSRSSEAPDAESTPQLKTQTVSPKTVKHQCKPSFSINNNGKED